MDLKIFQTTLFPIIESTIDILAIRYSCNVTKEPTKNIRIRFEENMEFLRKIVQALEREQKLVIYTINHASERSQCIHQGE